MIKQTITKIEAFANDPSCSKVTIIHQGKTHQKLEVNCPSLRQPWIGTCILVL